MSDGPHRSLPMRSGWKRVAEWADNQTFEAEDIGKAIIPALEKDCKGELSPEFISRLCAVCDGQEVSLFKNELGRDLERLRPVAGLGIGHVVLDFAIERSAREGSGRNIAVEAMTDALTDRAARCARQIEEHYCRESSERRAYKVRQRFEEGIGKADVDGLAHRILNLESGRSGRSQLKHEGLDDGVRF